MTVTMLRPPADAQPRRVTLREYTCPRCTRYLFSTNAEAGVQRQKCHGCRKWLLIDIETGKESRAAA